MKNPRSALLLAAACLLLGVVLGLSLGGQAREPVALTSTTRVVSDVSEDITLLVNINTASAEQLAALPGIGEGYAQNILDYREENGPFETKQSLLNVDGIGQNRLEAILDYITVGGTP